MVVARRHDLERVAFRLRLGRAALADWDPNCTRFAGVCGSWQETGKRSRLHKRHEQAHRCSHLSRPPRRRVDCDCPRSGSLRIPLLSAGRPIRLHSNPAIGSRPEPTSWRLPPPLPPHTLDLFPPGRFHGSHFIRVSDVLGPIVPTATALHYLSLHDCHAVLPSRLRLRHSFVPGEPLLLFLVGPISDTRDLSSGEVPLPQPATWTDRPQCRTQTFMYTSPGSLQTPILSSNGTRFVSTLSSPQFPLG